jgi:hypothetical protein
MKPLASQSITLALAILTLAASAQSKPINFTKDIKPIFQANCYKCHSQEKQKSDYRLDLKMSALKGGEIGGAILPGNSSKSLLIQYVAGTHDEIRMPPKGDMLSPAQVNLLRTWIDQGAKWDSSETVATTQATPWALLPLSSSPIPGVKNKNWVRNPIDSFVLAKLEAKGMTPAPQADRRTLIRRVTFDLTGLPPTPAEIDAFLKDPSPNAYEKVVDRLLASPRYGERWAQHWIDTVHFAETHGNDEDKPRPNAWPYRDYLIRSFNNDKPYKRFVEEQLAGDALFPNDPDATIATAFVAAGPWDESSQMGIMDGTLDKQIARYLDRDDMVMTTMSTFVSSTVHCARCHNHKFDPIPQTDYYALQAVFAGVDRVDRAYDADPKIAARRKDLQKQKQALESNTFPIATLLSDQTQERVTTWEKTQSPIAWTLLDPAQFTSAGGATLIKQPDHSLLATGPTPEKETYTITAQPAPQTITAIRLEVLADKSLPHNGPGRQPDNGNLHLSEFKVATVKNATTQPVQIKSATADFDQTDWTIAKSIDNNIDTAWGIHPQEGKSHFAIFQLKTPLKIEEGTQLQFTLQQLHGRQHVIGRPRLSITNSPTPLKTTALPENITRALAVSPAKRTQDDRITLAKYVLTQSITQDLAQLPPQSHIYAIASDFPAQGNFKPALKPREVNVLRRGDIRQPIEPATPGAMSCVTSLEPRFKLKDPQNEGSRRAALAHWITDSKNPLTWRSIVNRIWHYDFGRGIVETPNDFGKMGAAPTHPQLLDYLALTFRDEMGGSMKQLHRLIVTSATYRQSAATNPQYAASDIDNKYLWRANRSRLDAEEIRDSILAISGKLDLTMGGPSVKQFVETKALHETPTVDYTNFDVDSPASFRRSIYRFVFRTIPDPFMQTLDCPDSSQLTPKRETSVTALQALAMLNDKFVIKQSQHIAERLKKSSPDLKSQIHELYQLALSREPTETEITLIANYAQKFALPNAVRMLLNTNEFIFLN